MDAMPRVPDELVGVQAMVAEALPRVRACIEDALASPLPVASDLVSHLGAFHGKMLRPVLCLASSLACGGAIDDDAVRAAATVELVHLATLVHDDVLDEADLRRRVPTINRLRGNEAAVILGDYVIASAFEVCSRVEDRRASLIVARASMEMAAGELLQLHHREHLWLDEPTYYAILERKTGELIAASCVLGGVVAGAGQGMLDCLRSYGVALGVAFQVQDDLLDLTGSEGVVGKSVGKDAEKGKLTLPVIHHLAHAAPEARGATLDLLRTHAEAGRLRAALDSTGSIEHARAEARRLATQAVDSTASLPDSAARQYLRFLAHAATHRER
ncbi:MAG: polyprenyl synthetase family protein [Phycisphaerales bacterium]|jgi:octaprenyl-diphosphate synthase|nr:polyprenyl synthetase family protein [Phycisphaerales bacterium]